jgi:hypothetical protein
VADRSHRAGLEVTRNAHLIQMAALCVGDMKARRERALAALEQFGATGTGLRYAQNRVRHLHEAHHRALRALEAVANHRD